MKTVYFLSICFLFFCVFFLNSEKVEAAAFTSTQTGNWTIGTTWGNACASSCTAGTHYPSTNDTATIADTTTVTLDTSLTVQSVTINTGGTLTEDGSSRTLTITNASGTVWSNSGTFTANTSTVTFFPGGSNTITGSTTFNNLTFTVAGSSRTITISSGTILTVNGTTAIAGGAGSITLNTGDIYAKGNISLTNTGNGGGGSALITINGTGNQTVTGTSTLGDSRLPRVTIDKSTGDLTFTDNITVTSTFTTTSLGSGTFTTTGSTVGFMAASFTLTGSITLNNVTFNSLTSNRAFTIAPGTVITVNGTLTFSGSSSITMTTGDIHAKGNIVSDNSNTSSGGTTIITINGTGNQTITGNGVAGQGALSSIVVDKASGNLILPAAASKFTVAGNFTYTQGTIDYETTNSDSTIVFTNDQTISGSFTVKNLEFGGSQGASAQNRVISGTITVAGDLDVTSSNNIQATTGTIALKGNLNDLDGKMFSVATLSFLINGTNDQTITGASGSNVSDMGLWVINKASGTLNLAGNIGGAGFDYDAGTIDAGTSNFFITTDATIRDLTTSQSFYDFTIGYGGGGASQLALTINAGTTLKVTNDLTIAGTNANSTIINTGDIYVERNLTHSHTSAGGGGSATITLNGTGTQTLTGGTGSFPKITIDKTSGTLNLSGTIIIAGNWTYTQGTVDATTADSTVTTATALTMTSAGMSFDNLIINAGTTTLGNALTVAGNLTIAATRALNTGTNYDVSVAGNWTNAGSYTSGSNTTTFTGSGDSVVITGGTATTQDFQNFTVNKTGSGVVQLSTNGLDVDGTLTITSGTLDLNGQNLSTTTTCSITGILKLAGDETVSCTPTNNAGSTVEYSATSGTRDIKNWTYKNLKINGSGGTFTLPGTISLGEGLTVAAGTLSQGANLFTVASSATISGGTFSAGSLSSAWNAGLTISGGTFTGSTGDVDVNGALTLSSGVLTAPSGAFTVSGNWTVSGSPTFTPGTNTVTLDSATTATVSGATSFYNLTISHSAAKEVNFSTVSADIITVTNTFSAVGTSGNLIKLYSTSAGTKWHFKPTGTASADYADVKDGGCESGAVTVSHTNTTDSGNNESCWSFTVAPTVTTQAASSVTATTATGNGNITSTGNENPTTRGFVYGTTISYGSSTSESGSFSTGAFTGSITSLVCNTLYHIAAYATNSIGTSYGGDETFTTSACVPGAPTIGTATGGNAQASVAFTPPASNGGAAITSYTATSSPGNITGSGASSPVTVTGLTNGTAYTFTVTATNSAGTGAASSASNSVTPATVPGIPVNLAATVGDQSIPLSWSAPADNGGSSITDYVIEYKLTSNGTWSTFADGTSTTTSTTVTSLSNDNSYDFRVSAVNSAGQGNPSDTVTITPGAPAQVLIQSFSGLTTPSINTAVRITNEGSTAYEYQYTWCVTDSDSNLCGGGNDVFSSSAAKLIQPGENWDTTLSSTVSSAGNYYFHITVYFGSDSSHASQSFTATTTAASSSGGGGGIRRTASNTSCVGADFNHDNKVSSIDFSILLSFWKKLPPFKNPCVDINRDNQINSADFSILLYQWGKNPTAFKL